MPSEENLLSTPSNYATPQQLAAVREYAQALLYGSGQQQVHSPWQGVSNMVSALVGGHGLYKAGQQDRFSDLYDANKAPIDPGDTTAPPSKGVSSGAPGAGGLVPAAIRNNNPGAQWPGPISKAFGSTGTENIATGNKIATFDDPVKGAAAQFALLAKKYTGRPLASAIAEWSGNNSAPAYTASLAKTVGLTPDTVITPELLRSPQGVALAKAMAKWESGRDYPMSDQQWTAAQGMGLRTPTNGPRLAFNGEPSNMPIQAPDAPAPVASALAKGGFPTPPVAMPSPARRVPVGTEDDESYKLPPGLVPHAIPVTRDQLVNTLASRRLDPFMKQFTAQSYYSQRQPISVPTAGGSITIDPRNPTNQRFVPEVKWNATELPGGLKTSVPQYVAPGRGGRPELHDIDEPNTGKPVAPAPAQAPDLGDIPSLSRFAADEAPPRTMLSGLPPEIMQGASATPLSGIPAPGAKVPDDQTAQLSPRLERMWNDSTKKAVEFEGQKKFVDKDVEFFTKKYNQATELGRKAQETLPTLKIAKELVEDPKTRQGLFADPLMTWDRFMEAVGKDPKGGALNQVLDKIVSGNIVKDLKVELQGTGQVRVAEIALLEKAAASKYNSLPANRAVLELMTKAHEQTAALGRISNLYAQGVRWDSTGKPVVDRNGRPILDQSRPTNAGLDKALSEYVNNHPIATPEEIKNYSDLFEKDKKGQLNPDGSPKVAAPSSSPVNRGARDPAIEQEMRRRGLIK